MKTRVLRFEPFPLRVAQRVTQAAEWRRYLRGEDSYLCSVEWKRHCQEMFRRWDTVQLALVIVPPRYGWPRKFGWMLAYDGKPCSGTFKTRLECINWYVRGGR